MRLARFFLLATLPLAARAAIPLPDTPSVTDLEEFRLTCQSQQATLSLMESTGQKEKAAALGAALWERYDAEIFARRCALADLSLAALNPFLPAAERQAASDALGSAVAQLAELSTFASPDAASRLRILGQAGATPTETQRTRAETHATLQKIREQLALEAIALPEVAHLRRDMVAKLTRAAVARQPLEELLATTRELPTATEALANLTRKFAEPGVIEELFVRTGESLALEATLTALVEAAPANSVFWLARARARLKLGWRAGAVADLTIASHLDPATPGVSALGQTLRETPASLAAVCQEWVEPDDANEVIRLRQVAQAAGQPATALAPALERSARAAFRNRARRLYATSFLNKPETRQRAITQIARENPVPPGLFPFVGPEFGQQFEAEITASATDAAQRFAVLQRHAALFGVTEGFWYQHVVSLLGTGQQAAAFAATDIAGAMFAQSTWVKEARAKTEPAPAQPAAASK